MDGERKAACFMKRDLLYHSTCSSVEGVRPKTFIHKKNININNRLIKLNNAGYFVPLVRDKTARKK